MAWQLGELDLEIMVRMIKRIIINRGKRNEQKIRILFNP